MAPALPTGRRPGRPATLTRDDVARAALPPPTGPSRSALGIEIVVDGLLTRLSA